MNYIALNGVKSTSVKGLLIEELPPISKPKIRTEKEEIDGRDGDIVTKLGYSAYDKELAIGLHGDYDIDDAIQYFDSDGEVVFSNEPDKYYRYQILDEIDFERLIRFRKAKIKLHVQPFKYDAVNRELSLSNQMINFKNWSSSKYGVSITSSYDGTITINGMSENTVEFYVPIEAMTLSAGNYILSADVAGSADGSAVRLIADSPSNANTFGGAYISMKNDKAIQLSSYDSGNKKYNYLWFYIPTNTYLNCTINVTLSNQQWNSLTIHNRGNMKSKPIVTIYGSGTVELSLNGTHILDIKIDENYVTIDSEEMNAYHDGTLKNRMVTGDYANLVLNTGDNELSWNGDVTKIIIENYSRWK